MPNRSPDTTEPDRVAPRALLRRRGDLHWQETPSDLGGRWRVKDPLTLAYHEVGADEHFLLEQLDGETPLEEVRRRYNQRFRPRSVSAEGVARFAAEALRKNLVIADGRGQARDAAQQLARGRWARWLLAALYVRLPGFDPNPLLSVVGPMTRWFWSPLTMAGVAVAALLAVALLIGNAGELAVRLPTLSASTQASSLCLLLIAFAAVKAIHELAHGLACRHVGARCHEMGVSLIGLLPLPYCDVTDLWMIPSRGKRALVAAAGMYAELVIAVVCCYLWLAAAEGMVADVLLSLMIACGVSTLVFNLNPLLKLDGYYLLSDLADLPNLHERARRALLAPLAGWFRSDRRRLPAERFEGWLAGYALASLAYRLFVLGLIAMAVYTLFASLGLRPVGDLLVAAAVVGLLAAPVAWLAAVTRSPIRRRVYRWGRVGLAGVVVIGAVGLAMTVSFPRTVATPALFEVRDTRAVAATIEGRLVEVVREGQAVSAGQMLARLENPQLARRRHRLAAQLREQQQRLANLRRRATLAPALLPEIPAAEALVAQAAGDLQQLDREIARLTVVAPCGGVVIGAPPRASGDSALDRHAWRGRLTDPTNRGCWVEQGDVVCLVAPDTESLQATLVIDAAETKGIRPGLPARVLAYASHADSVRSVVGEVARVEGDRLPEAFRLHPELAGFDRRGRATLVLLARVDLPSSAPVVEHGTHGRCKIEVAGEPLGTTAWRWLAQTFPFRF